MAHGRRHLARFLEDTGKSQAWLAGQLAVSTSHVSRILAGKVAPSLALARRIEDLTGIPAREFAAEAA